MTGIVPSDGSARLRKLHSFSGVCPLGLFLVFHAWQQAAVLEGRDAQLARLEATTSGSARHGLAEVVLVLVPLMVHAFCGLRLAARTKSEVAEMRPHGSAAFRRFQAGTGIVTALFLGAHLSGVWRPFMGAGRSFAAFSGMLDQSGTLLAAAGYVVGVSATCVHFGHGLSAFILRWWPSCSPTLARAVGGLLGSGVWLMLVDELAVYATGAALM